MVEKPKLLEQVKQKIRLKRYSIRTEQAYVSKILLVFWSVHF